MSGGSFERLQAGFRRVMQEEARRVGHGVGGQTTLALIAFAIDLAKASPRPDQTLAKIARSMDVARAVIGSPVGEVPEDDELLSEEAELVGGDEEEAT